MNIIKFNQFKQIYSSLLRASKGKIENRKEFNEAMEKLAIVLDKEAVKLGEEI